MPYVPHTDPDRQEMLAQIGATSIDDLFREIPPTLRIAPGALKLPPALDEPRLMAHMHEIAAKNLNLADLVSFLGAGVYDRYIPATVSAVISRGEFLTAYTPYQPELSQGYLQTIYEFQTMIAELYGMDIANASMYDGPTSMAEAAIMAVGVNGRTKIAISEAIHLHYREVMATYAWSLDLEVITVPTHDGLTPDLSLVDAECACYVTGYPNFFGQIEDLAAARLAASQAGALLIVVADPTACVLLRPPGEFGADVVVGEGQPLGIAMGFGGPYLGLFACRQEFVRRIPGRIVGRTKEVGGERTGYVMTLRTREQDIRREKATSNICTNEALMALAATVYLCALGKNGMRAVAEATVRNTQFALAELTAQGIPRPFPGRVFGEFVVRLNRSASAVRDQLLAEGFLAGLPLGPYFKGMERDLLIAVTELRTRDQIERFVNALGAANRAPRLVT